MTNALCCRVHYGLINYAGLMSTRYIMMEALEIHRQCKRMIDPLSSAAVGKELGCSIRPVQSGLVPGL